MRTSLLAAAATLALAAHTPAAQAATQLGDYFSIGGFGTLGAVRTNTDDAQFGRDRQNGGATTSPALDVDSNLGVQLTGTATPWLSATVQVLTAKRDLSNVETKFEWAYVLVKPLDGLAVRAGRMPTPVFAISDSRNIGYANNWVRAPNEVYALNVFRNFDGADATYRLPIGSQSISLTLFGGKTTFRPLGVDAKGDDLRGINLVWETEWATFRAGKALTNVSIPAFNQVGDGYSFTGYGVLVDRNDIVAQAELVHRRSAGQPGGTNAQGWYLMGGYRVGAVLPYAIVAQTRPTVDSSFHLSGNERTTSLGVRWDAFSAADLKFQIDRVDPSNTQGISFTTPALPFPGPKQSSALTHSVTAISVALDFTF